MSHLDGGMVSAAGSGTDGATIGATVEDGNRDEGTALVAAVTIVAGAGGLETVPAAGGAGLTAAGAGGEPDEVTGETTVREGRAGSAAITAMTSSGLSPSNSAF